MHLVRHVPVHQHMIRIGLAIAHHSCFHSYQLVLLGQKKKDSDVVTDGTVGWRRRNYDSSTKIYASYLGQRPGTDECEAT